jgi:hypothetical protein
MVTCGVLDSSPSAKIVPPDILSGMGFADEAPGAQQQPEVPEGHDPTEYLPVMRHHLHEALWALNLALGYIEANDLADSYRAGLQSPRKSPLSRSLSRSHETLTGYLGLRNAPQEEDDEDGGE